MKNSLRIALLTVLTGLGLRLQAASTIEFARPTIITVLENVGAAVLTVLRLGDADSRVTVDFASLDSTAKAGSDYQASAGTVTFEAGQTNQAIVVTILNDALPEATERFTVALANPSANAALGTAVAATITITDNDPGIQVEFAQYMADEGSETVSIAVTRGPCGAGSV